MSSSSKIQRITEAKCREWAANPTINPLSGKEIDINGPTYNALKERCLNKYNIALPSALVAPEAPAGPANSSSSSASSASSASIETKNKTAGWKRDVPKTKTGALAIIDLIGQQIWNGLKALVTAQNKDPVNGLKNFNVSKVFKNLPYYRPYIDSIVNNQAFFDSPEENIRFMQIEDPLLRKALRRHQSGSYTEERLVRLVDPNAPKVIVILYKVFTFLQSLNHVHIYYYYIHPINSVITAVLNAIQPHLAEAQRQVDNLNIAILLRRARSATNTVGADALTRDIAELLLTRRPAQAPLPQVGPDSPVQGGRKLRKLKK